MSSVFVRWLCLWLNAKTVTGQRPLQKLEFSVTISKKKKNYCLKKRALALKVRCFSSYNAMDYQLVPFQRVVLTL